MPQPWYREVSREQWKTFLTTFAAWTLDAFQSRLSTSYAMSFTFRGLFGIGTHL